MARRHRWWMFGWGLILLLGLPLRLEAATYYLGAFTGSTPLDDADCGTGLGTHPNPHPCATLAYWTQNRRATALVACSPTSPCTVRFAPGTYATFAGNTDYNHCVIAQSNTTYEGRLADDSGLPADFNAVTIDAANAGNLRFTGPCRARTLTPLNAGDAYPDTSVAQIQNFTVRYLTLANAPWTSLEYRAGAALYGAAGSTNLIVDHVRVTGNKSGGLMIGEENWRTFMCATTKVYCSGAILGTDCGNGNGICSLGLDYDCAATGRRTTNVTVVDSQFDRNCADQNAVGTGGLSVGCLDIFTIQRVKTFYNRPGGESGNCCAEGTGCDGPHGFNLSYGTHGKIDTLESYDNAEGDINVGGSQTYAEHDNTLERLYWHEDCGSTQSKRSGLKHTGGHDDIIRNSYGVGTYFYNVEEYNCSYNVLFENNTLWSTAPSSNTTMAMHSDYMNGWTFRNNIFFGNSQGIATIQLSGNTLHDSTNLWDHNVVVNPSGLALRDWGIGQTAACTCTQANVAGDCGAGGVCYQNSSFCMSGCVGGNNNGKTCSTNADCPGGTCSAPPTLPGRTRPTSACLANSDCNANGVCTNNVCTQGWISQPCTVNADCNQRCLTIPNCQTLTSHNINQLNDYNPPVPTGNILDDTAAGLATFQGVANGWFGGGKGAGEKWGTAPAMVSPASPSPANLHLVSTDTIARDAGISIPGLTTDYDGQARPFGPTQRYDIGADEYSTAAVGLVGDLDGNSVVDVLDLQRLVNLLLGV